MARYLAQLIDTTRSPHVKHLQQRTFDNSIRAKLWFDREYPDIARGWCAQLYLGPDENNRWQVALLVAEVNRITNPAPTTVETFDHHTENWAVGRWQICGDGSVRHSRNLRNSCCAALQTDRGYRCRWNSAIHVSRAYLEREVNARRFERR